jgi:hypothetical protein
MAHHKKHTKAWFAERKATLIAEGKSYRLKIAEAKKATNRRLENQSLFQAVLGQLGQTAYAAFKNRKAFRNLTLQSVLPLVAGGFSLLSKKSLLKPVLYGSLLLGGAGTLVTILKRKKIPQT